MNREAELFTLLRSVIKKTRKILEREIAPFGVGHAEMRLLMMLYDMDGCTQEELASKIEVDRTNVGRSLKKMEFLGYVERRRNPRDSRGYRVFLTPRSWDLRGRMIYIVNCLEKTTAAGVNEEELSLLLELLRKVDLQVDEGRYLAIKETHPFLLEKNPEDYGEKGDSTDGTEKF